MPNDFKNLTVNLLSGDSASIRGLEASVNAINDELSNADISSYRRQIKKLEEELRELEGKIAQDSNELIKIKEKSTRKQEINDYYHGTLLEIAEGLEKDANKYGWYRDDYSDIKNLEIVENVKNYFLLRKEFIKYKVEKLRLELPQKEKIILGKDIEYFNKLIKEIKSRKIIENQIEGIKSKNYVLLRKELDTLGSILIDIEARPHIFKKQIIEDEINDLGEKWGNKINTSRKIIEKLAGYNLVEIDRNYEIKYPKGKGLVDLKNDANTLLSYSKKNGNISGIKFLFKKPFLPREIKEKLYFIEAVKVNGSPCDTESEFNSVIRDIDIKQNYDELTRIWNIKLDYDLKKYNELFDDISRFQKKIETLYAYIKNARKEIKEIERISDIRIKSYDVKYIESLQRKVIDILILKEYKRLRKNINESTKYLSKDEFHPIALQIKEKISELNIGMLGKLLEDLENLKNIKEQYKEHKILEEGLNLVMPNLIEDIKMNRIDKENLMELDKAIYFKDANKKLKRLLNEDYEQKLLEDLSYYDSKKEELISKIASLKAWEHVLHNLEENRTLRQHLEAWVQAVKRIGKTGRGKRALKFRNVAQEEMESCKMAVPCWIMPLYKITETIKPQKEMYDYVIVDEASQLGPDAIFLLYITKNIIIVGDDKQTSPEYIGIDANAMEPYIKKYLKGIPFSNFYGTEFSFFAHAKRFCEGLIVLREHFRCMPEIIEFSNKLFYAPDGKGLYPLKQYSENRLEPLRHVFCQDGFIEGSGQNIRNYNEAKSIVNKISELIKDPKYAGKTMGVISLQGTGQSVLIENLLIKEIGEREFKERKIICGNSASFQGDERDIIILSLVTAHNHRRNALMRPEDERRFNVAVSRAKEQAWLFHSVEMEDLSNTGDLRYKILDHFINYRPENIPKNNKIKRTIGRSPKPFDSWFEVDVYNNIVERGYRVIPQYEVAKGKYRIDLVAIFPNGSKIAIECDGDKWHGSEEYKNDIMRQKVLERCGWQFFRIRGGEYYANRENALTPLWEIFEKNKAVRYEEINNKKAEVSERNLDKVKKELKNKIAFEGEGWHEKIEDDENLLPENKLKRKSDIIQNNKGSNEIYKIRIGSLNIPELWNKSEILLFSDRYNVYKIKNMGFNDTRDVLSSVRVENNEKIIYITGTSNYTGFMIFGFENGKVAKVYMNSYKTVTQRKKLANAYNKKSKLLYVDHIKYDMDLVAISSVNKVLVFNTSLILAKDSRIAQGHQVMKSKKNSVMRMIKKANEVKFESVEYYRKQIPATGNYLKREDKII
ncbi:hypothetical protein BMS3Bbin03_01475 [bacterium BMS3Bbin03]|nr:hypothetical protein BMS3Bbin03_01475 [bacterium BMS3Bbin03]